VATYIILSRTIPGAFEDPKDLKQLASTVASKIRSECPGVSWKTSFATMGHYDFVDVVESDDPKQVANASMLIRAYGRSSTETLPATPWKEFLDMF
jgi:uncharacterized protein with GYD domain